MMRKVDVLQKVSVPAANIWNILRTGTDLDKWLPIIATCQVEGNGAGAKRICTTPEGKILKETILLVDDANKVFKYRIDEQDILPTKNYVGTVSVSESNGQTEVRWSADFDMTIEAAWPEVEKGLTDILTVAITGLASAAKA